MILTVIATISLLAFCSGENAQRLRKNHAISSQTFHRADVPISYNHTTIHMHSSPRSGINSEAQPRHAYRQNYQGIQYAPLYNIERHTRINLSPSTEAQSLSEQSIAEIQRKQPLEPRITATKNLDSPFLRSFVPGHNVEVLQSVNRSPGHNAVYRSYPVTYLRAYVMNQTPGPFDATTTSQPDTIPEIHKDVLHAFLTRQNSNPISFLPRSGDLPLIENSQTQNPHPKGHRLHLNVARIYGVAQAIPKGEDPANLDVIPRLSQAVIGLTESIKLKAREQKTFLYPVEYNNKHYVIESSS